MPMIASDKDLPKLLDTPTKQVKWAKKLVAQHLGSTAKRVDKPPMQGMFSRTLFLTLADGRELVLQFRTEPLDLDAFKTARGVLGSVVPDARALEDEELLNDHVWAYSLTRLHGKMWIHGVAGKGPEGRIAINRSLGQIFSKGCLTSSSGEAVVSKIQPHLEAILASPLQEISPYRQRLESFLDKLEQFKQLPLWVAHYDLNDLNILIDDDCRVTGLVDWELSSPLPFGVGFGRIHTLAGEYTGGEFWMPDEFEVAERAFWTELFDGMPADIRDALEKQMVLAQDAVILGTLLSCFIFEDGQVGFNPVSLKALPKFLTYRIPFIRGTEAPYMETGAA
ncbi:hypothetical protein EsDP_00003638 [Epichloe bromicola]|uniref:Aminoglycoside phosphotransferase domain-containing protein n=1 Tax=Epichloe bromicola TaxID=79588 RepID=A0ABQ0CPD9_9HYPO